MIIRTQELLAAMPEIWQDGHIAFGIDINPLGNATKEAVLSYFRTKTTLRSLSGLGSHELQLTASALNKTDLSDAHRGLAQLLKNEVRMFSGKVIATHALDQIAAAFFDDMAGCKVYTNKQIRSNEENSNCLGSWTPVTKHSMDMFICAVTDTRIGYWLYGDDE